MASGTTTGVPPSIRMRRINWSAWPVLNPGVAIADTNKDGIPDEWLQTNFPGKTANDLNNEGYTCLEVYLNSLVSQIITGQNSEAISSGANSPVVNSSWISAYVNSQSNKLIVNSEKIIDRIEVYGISGNLMMRNSMDAFSNEFDMSLFNKGVYLIRFITENKEDNVVKKVIKI